MMTISFCVNLIVLALVIPQLWGGAAGMEAAFGPDTTARQILTCVYAAIWLVSLIGLIAIILGNVDRAVTLGVGLLTVQIVYKLMTVPVIGFDNPVVMTNLPIALLHCITLAVILLRHSG